MDQDTMPISLYTYIDMYNTGRGYNGIKGGSTPSGLVAKGKGAGPSRQSFLPESTLLPNPPDVNRLCSRCTHCSIGIQKWGLLNGFVIQPSFFGRLDGINSFKNQQRWLDNPRVVSPLACSDGTWPRDRKCRDENDSYSVGFEVIRWYLKKLLSY
jgi:hypothetical protein